MWAPADKTAVPTREDLVYAKGAIHHLEKKLKDVEKAIVDLQISAAEMTKDLEQRRAWISLIRRLPFDVLSYIFITANNVNWKLPVSISGVCRQWRDVVLATPQAWTSFSTEHPEGNIRWMHLYMKRSGQCLMHARVFKLADLNDYHNNAHRIQTMTTYIFGDNRVTYSRVTRLRVISQNVNLSLLGIQFFPELIHLDLGGRVTRDHDQVGVVVQPLSSLKFCISGSWEDTPRQILNDSQNSLTSLEIDYRLGVLHNPDSVIRLPVLKYLRINWGIYTPSGVPVILETPVLVTYIQTGPSHAHRKHLLHTGITTITHLRLNHVPLLKDLSSLRILQLSIETKDYADLITQLESRDTCPNLTVLELRGKEAEAAFDLWVQQNRPGLRLLFSTESWAINPPDS